MDTMSYHADSADFTPAMTELEDALARVRAQLHVLRLAISGGLRNEGDVRALLSQLGGIEEELSRSEGLVSQQAGAP
jgi:hypothetical protein